LSYNHQLRSKGHYPASVLKADLPVNHFLIPFIRSKVLTITICLV
jgi:hypothetical protein